MKEFDSWADIPYIRFEFMPITNRHQYQTIHVALNQMLANDLITDFEDIYEDEHQDSIKTDPTTTVIETVLRPKILEGMKTCARDSFLEPDMEKITQICDKLTLFYHKYPTSRSRTEADIKLRTIAALTEMLDQAVE